MNIFAAVKYCCILHGRVCVMPHRELGHIYSTTKQKNNKIQKKTLNHPMVHPVGRQLLFSECAYWGAIFTELFEGNLKKNKTMSTLCSN